MLIILGVLVLGWLELIGELWLHRPARDQATIYLRLIPELSRLVLRLLSDRGTPARYRLALLGLAAWLANPIDLVPDFLPVIGVLDDVIIAALVLRWVGRGVGMTRIENAWNGSDQGLALLRRVLAARGHHI
jgi:uncharacterized membrane protein YkvA (DUF1232 family)